MIIRPFPCAATVICGPCIPCSEFYDLSRSAPDARVVYVPGDPAWSFTGGYITYNTGGSPTTISMSVVGSTQKLCLGRDQSVNGPLVYSASVPLAATITEIGFTYDPYGGGDTITLELTPSAACTDYLTQIVRIPGALSCYATPTVVLQSDSCAPCTDPTGTSSKTDGGAGGVVAIYRNSTCSAGTSSCGSTATTASANWTTPLSIRPLSWTPGSSARPCNWLDIEFAVTLVSSGKYYGPGTPLAGIESCTVTYTKTAGSAGIVTTSAAGNCIRSGCVAGYDQLVRTNYITRQDVIPEFNIPCTTYKLRQRHTCVTSDQCVGGGRYIPELNQVTADLMPQ